MNKLLLALLFLFFPILAMAADGSLTFTPPRTDFSVIFLSNIFGTVDGVLHGTGSQMLGTMFGVLNAAVLALGGIIIMYTLMVSTLNTAQEGQFLGQKWSSLWVPVRTTFGLALLIPKASGYCLMQIFVMWIVVQGVGAADKIWNAALSYLNRGGAIIMAQEASKPPVSPFFKDSSGLANGAQAILAGQVCMQGLEAQLKKQREAYLKKKQDNSGPCYGSLSSEMKKFCNQAIPNFINSVNVVSIQNNSLRPADNAPYQVTMPNFSSTSVYASLNGICGVIEWNPFSISREAANRLNYNEQRTALMSRAIAIQQMYVELANVARAMVNNHPAFSRVSVNEPYSAVAIRQFGVPKNVNGTLCGKGDDNCFFWGPLPGSNGTTLLSGTEFEGAIDSYNNVMQPTLNLERHAGDIETARTTRKFISKASSEGWIMAGSYFFDLVALNQKAMAAGLAHDTNTGLGGSRYPKDNIKQPFSKGCDKAGQYSILCKWFDNNINLANQIEMLISGGDKIPAIEQAPDLSNKRFINVKNNKDSSTVYGFASNASLLDKPGQPGFKKLDFANVVHVEVDPRAYRLPEMSFPCGGIKIGWSSFCIGELFGDLFYNKILLQMYNYIIAQINVMLEKVLWTFLELPLQGLGSIFRHGMELLSAPGVNPIIALANMGTYYINFTGELFVMITEVSIAMLFIQPFGLVVMALIALAAPLLMAWMGTMVAIGFITAYYVPVLPYLLFLFGSIGWFIAVIEAMVAAPLVALGVTHPEGHESFGKGEQAIMILMNVFLRPSMMIIGYIAGISLSYVGVWVLNAGYDNAISFVQKPEKKEFGSYAHWDEDLAGAMGERLDIKGQDMRQTAQNIIEAQQRIGRGQVQTGSGYLQASGSDVLGGYGQQFQGMGEGYFNTAKLGAQTVDYAATAAGGFFYNAEMRKGFEDLKKWAQPGPIKTDAGTIEGGYTSWAGIFAFFFSILIYTTTYLVIVQKSFSLIAVLPDKVLRWIGGQPEGIGSEASQWGEEVKGKVGESAKETTGAKSATEKQAAGHIQKGASKAKGMMDKASQMPASAVASGGKSLGSVGKGGSGGGPPKNLQGGGGGMPGGGAGGMPGGA